MKITIIGSGYVGLVSGACFADFGYEVVCVDTDADKIAGLKAGKMPIYEPGLDVLIENNVQAGRLTFTTDLASAMEGTAVAFVAVGTPSRRGDGHADLSYVFEAAKSIASHIKSYTVVVMKSTVPVGTGDAVEKILAETLEADMFSAVSNPEFLREGAAIEDFKRPDRVVIGANDARAREVMKTLYQPLSLKEAPVILTDRRSSELIKYASNAFLATKITFINEMADLCEVVGADVQQVAQGMGLDNRIGSKFLNAGPGYGGSCFPKDTLALIKTADDSGVPLQIVKSVKAVNDERKRMMGQKVVKACGGDVNGKTIAMLGLTFKPNTDDMRDSPSIDIVSVLQEAGANVRAYDPQGMENAKSVIDGIDYADDVAGCMEGADAMVLVTEHDMFRAMAPEEIKKRLKAPIVVDLRNVFRPAEMAAAGVSYTSIGRV